MPPKRRNERVPARIEWAGLRELRRAMRAMPDDAKKDARAAANRIATREASRIASAARRTSRQAGATAPSIKATRGAIPGVQGGGSRKVKMSGRPVEAGKVFFGAEFGGQGRPTTQQFMPHRGREGYFFWPTLRADVNDMFAEYGRVVDSIARKWETAG